MQQQRDLNRTRERIMAAAQKEFAANGFAGARTDAIARRAHVNERMIFYCFESKEGLYRAVLAQKLSAKAALLVSMPDEDFASSLIRGFAECCDDNDSLRMWQWEALDRSSRKLVAEEERRAFLQSEVARWRRAIALPSPRANRQASQAIFSTLTLARITLRIGVERNCRHCIERQLPEITVRNSPRSARGAVRACNRWRAAGRAGRPRRDRSPPRGAPVRRRRPQCHGHAGSPRPRCQPDWLWRSGSCRPRAPP